MIRADNADEKTFTTKSGRPLPIESIRLLRGRYGYREDRVSVRGHRNSDTKLYRDPTTIGTLTVVSYFRGYRKIFVCRRLSDASARRTRRWGSRYDFRVQTMRPSLYLHVRQRTVVAPNYSRPDRFSMWSMAFRATVNRRYVNISKPFSSART